MNKEMIKSCILGYMSTRCLVSSQHKLPTLEEFHSTQACGLLLKLGLFDKDDVDKAFDELLEDKKLIMYGPYISDHTIDVL